MPDRRDDPPPTPRTETYRPRSPAEDVASDPAFINALIAKVEHARACAEAANEKAHGALRASERVEAQQKHLNHGLHAIGRGMEQIGVEVRGGLLGVSQSMQSLRAEVGTIAQGQGALASEVARALVELRETKKDVDYITRRVSRLEDETTATGRQSVAEIKAEAARIQAEMDAREAAEAKARRDSNAARVERRNRWALWGAGAALTLIVLGLGLLAKECSSAPAQRGQRALSRTEMHL